MFQQIISRVGRALDKARIKYMIIGGQAVLFYGVVRLTKDIDITLGVSIDRLPQLVKIIDSLNLKIIPRNYRVFVSRTMVLPVENRESKIRVDFVFSFTPYEQQAIKRAKKVKLGRAIVKIASLEDVIIHKIFSGRAKDIEDVQSIIVKHPDFDTRYIRKWLKEFSEISETKQNFLRIFNTLIMK